MAVKLTKRDFKKLKDMEAQMRHTVDAWDETMDVKTCAFIETATVREWIDELTGFREELERRRHSATLNCPDHYLGDGWITCEDAMESMLAAAPDVKGIVARWWADALKYVWRWPLKRQPCADLEKARSCVNRLEGFVKRNDWTRR